MRLFYLFVCIVSLLGCVTKKDTIADHSQDEKTVGYLIKSPSGVILTADDVVTTLSAAPPGAKQSILGNGESFMKFATNQYISKQFVDYAIKHQLDQDPEIVAKLRDYRNRLLSNAAVDHYVSLQALPDFTQLARERYLIKRDKYRAPEKLLLSHILIRAGDKHSDDEARKIATKVYEKAKQGKDFAELAVEYSEDSSSAKGGDLGWVKKGQMIKPFESAAFNLQKSGDVSEVIKTRYGYHIIKLLGKKPERQLEFDEVKPQIIQALEAEHKKELQSQLLLQHDINEQTDVNADAISKLYVRLKNSLKKK
ncbi:MAG TPA: hypothetical protein ENJ32_09330 [Crenotrichaceae bacterium]|nr:hypothetical protein [Crenotrichaceae bacterium]